MSILRNFFVRFSLAFFTVLSVLSSCEKEENNEPLERQVVISKNYLDLSSSNSSFLSFNEKSGIVVVEIRDESIPQVGNVFVWTSDSESSIRRIKSIKQIEGNYELETEEAALTDIFLEGKIVLKTQESPDVKSSIDTEVFFPDEIVTEDGSTKSSEQWKLETSFPFIHTFWSSGDEFSGDPQQSLSCDGTFSSSFGLELDFNFDSDIEAIEKALSSQIEITCKVVGNIDFHAGLFYHFYDKRSLNLPEVLLKKDVIKPKLFKFYPYGVPVFIQCRTDLLTDCSMSLETSSELKVDMGYSLETEVGVTYSQKTNEFKTFHTATQTVMPLNPTASGQFTFEQKASIYPRFYIYLYGLIGPVLDFKPYYKQVVNGETEHTFDGKYNYHSCMIASAFLGMDVAAKMHLRPFSNDVHDDPSSNDINLFEKEIFRSPSEIQLASKPSNGKQTVLFEVFDYYPLSNMSTVSSLEIPVIINTLGKESEVLFAKDGKVSYDLDSDLREVEAVILKSTGELSSAKYSPTLRDVLEKIYYDTNGDNWFRKDNWCSDEPIETWYGVGKYSQYGEDSTYIINLANNNLTGEFVLNGLNNCWQIILEGNTLSSITLGNMCLHGISFEDNPLRSLYMSGVTSSNIQHELMYSGHGSIYIDKNNSIESIILENCEVGDLYFTNNAELKHVIYNNSKIFGYLYSAHNKKLEAVDGSSSIVHGYFYCTDCSSIKEIRVNLDYPLNIDVGNYAASHDCYIYLSDLPLLEKVVVTGSMGYLDVSNCPSLTELPTKNINIFKFLSITDCSSLREIHANIDDSQKMEDDDRDCHIYLSDLPLLERIVASGSMDYLYVSNCPSLTEIPTKDITRVSSIEIYNCQGIRYFDCSNSPLLERLIIGSCDNLIDFGWDNCPSMKEIFITECKKILKLITPDYDSLIDFRYNPRFEYGIGRNEEPYWKDRGYGWWYEGEPDRGYHIK